MSELCNQPWNWGDECEALAPATVECTADENGKKANCGIKASVVKCPEDFEGQSIRSIACHYGPDTVSCGVDKDNPTITKNCAKPKDLKCTAKLADWTDKSLLNCTVEAIASCDPGWLNGVQKINCPVDVDVKCNTLLKDKSTPDVCPAPAIVSSKTTSTWSIPTSTSTGNDTSADSSPNATGTRTPQRPDNAESSGLSGGAVAGVAIGCLVAGAALAAVIAFLLLRRRKSRRGSNNTAPIAYNDGVPPSEKHLAVATTAATSKIDDFLPQPVADDAIQKDLSRLRDNIKDHVRSFYHVKPVNIVDTEGTLAALSSAVGLSSAALHKSLLNSSQRPDVIRLLIAWVVLSRCDGRGQGSLLPSDLAPLAGAIPKEGPNNNHAVLYSKWKSLTSTLYQPQDARKRGGAIPPAGGDAMAELDSILAPFIQQGVDNGERKRNLELIISRAASLAFLLFSQPGSFQFDFSADGGRMVIFPALLQVVDDQARSLRSPRLLSDKEYAIGG